MQILPFDLFGPGDLAPALSGQGGNGDRFAGLLRDTVEPDRTAPADKGPADRPERADAPEPAGAPEPVEGSEPAEAHEPVEGSEQADDDAGQGAGDDDAPAEAADADAGETDEAADADAGETDETAGADAGETDETAGAPAPSTHANGEPGVQDGHGAVTPAANALAMVQDHAQGNPANAVLTLIASAGPRLPGQVGETARTATGTAAATQLPPSPAGPLGLGLGLAEIDPLARAAAAVEQAPAFTPEKVLPEDAAKGRAFAAPRLAQVTLSHEGRQFVSHPSSALVPNAGAAMVEAAAAEEATHSTTLARVAPAAAEFKPATGGTALAASSALERAMAGSTQLAEDAAALRLATAAGGGASQAQPQVQTAALDPVPTIAANAAEFRHAIPTQPAAPVNSLRPAVEVSAPFEQVAVQIHRAASLGMDRIIIQLKPASLGRIGVQLEVGHDGRVTAVIAADRPETLELLQRDARGLERALEQAGLRTDSGSLSFNLSDRNHGDMPSLAEADGSGAADDAAETEVSDEPAVAVTDVIGAGIGADGRIDIRV